MGSGNGGSEETLRGLQQWRRSPWRGSSNAGSGGPLEGFGKISSIYFQFLLRGEGFLGRLGIKWFSMHSYVKCIFNLRTFRPTDTVPIWINSVGRGSTVKSLLPLKSNIEIQYVVLLVTYNFQPLKPSNFQPLSWQYTGPLSISSPHFNIFCKHNIASKRT